MLIYFPSDHCPLLTPKANLLSRRNCIPIFLGSKDSCLIELSLPTSSSLVCVKFNQSTFDMQTKKAILLSVRDLFNPSLLHESNISLKFLNWDLRKTLGRIKNDRLLLCIKTIPHDFPLCYLMVDMSFL
jgi:hypothetical protein